MLRDLPTGTVTFLFTDVEGSTRLLHELGAETYADALAEHRQVIREACDREGGVEVDTQGDAFFFAFPTAPGALAAAGRLTEALAPGPIQVRVGLHTGTPFLGGEGYVGDDVHLAARVAASAHGGQVVLSRATAELVELPLADLGEHRLKDIQHAVAIFQLGEATFPPLKTISNTNLPRPASSFLGRERELSEVLARIEEGARLVTLTGPGGTGKTRLALEAASSLVPEYKAGVFWIGLASLRDPDLVTETIAQTLGAKDFLTAHIEEREMLLLLDNLEQVIEAAPELSALLRSCPNLTLLVTSRELLRIQGEVEYPVPPLAEPEAVSLFCERSRLESSEVIAELCARLDSLPLAVELAAARTKALSPAQILERLSSGLDLLKGGRDADPRQLTLRATIEWSYELLSSAEQQLFGRSSVFAGGCTLEAAEEVAEADLDTLQSLVEKSLLRFSNERYWMLETIREFAAERLGPDERELYCQRHAAWIASFAVLADTHLERGDQAESLARFEAELGNVRAALDYWKAADEVSSILELSARCWRFWWMRGYWDEGRKWLELGLTAEDLGLITLKALAGAVFLAYLKRDFQVSRELAERHLHVARSLGDGREIGKALHALGNVALEIGSRDDAKALYEESLSWSHDDPFSRYTLHSLGYIAVLDGDADRARSFLQRSLAVSRLHEDESAVADTLGVLAFAALSDNQHAAAADLLRASSEIAVRLGDKPVIATRCLQGAAVLLAERGASREAAQVLGATDQLLDDIGAGGRGQIADLMERRTLDAISRVLGPNQLEAERSRGRKMTVDEALEVTFALADERSA